ncbi:SUF system Fe-S cluster assembly regulator [Pacificimonas flava]|uniref:SUF system Fe-S cluster assembly regulator n=2 Tax=Pacificimonas TaxID=1960290 RepID=A0A219B2M1_9SPHN|nr:MULTISPECIES: SUF system Fe-S cluster assembly regulator [Pacificimonas]MBZ6377732.1 SUF system Fe-S cluster assembly regulator [Pacificimonas aurantium]OWV32590.1 SUF system Fe-S cluster assembly regulator [Pacificimonas flava]
MLRLSNLADYAVLACTQLARADGRVSAADLADATQVPAPTMAKLTGILTRAGLLASSRGPSGGVMLALEPDDISLADIIEAVDGPIGLVACTHANDAEEEACQLSATCQAKPHWAIINDSVRSALSSATLADLAREQGAAEGAANDMKADDSAAEPGKVLA